MPYCVHGEVDTLCQACKTAASDESVEAKADQQKGATSIVKVAEVADVEEFGLSPYDDTWNEVKESKYKAVTTVKKFSGRPGDGMYHNLDLSFLGHCSQLLHLDLAFEAACFNLSSLATLPLLRTLKLGSVSVEEFKKTRWQDLGRLKLEEFVLSSEAVTDTAFLPLPWRKSLRVLSLLSCVNLVSVTGLDECVALQRLDVSNTKLSNFQEFSSLTVALQSTVVASLLPTSPLPESMAQIIAQYAIALPLKELIASGLILKSLQGIQALAGLELLDLGYSLKDVREVSELATLTTLKSLNLNGGADVEEDALFVTLRQLPLLTELSLWDYAQVESLAKVIPPLTKLENVQLWGTQVRDLTPLLQCPGLKFLHATTNGDPFDESFREIFPYTSCNNEKPLRSK
eukprot:gb/GEZN01006551.1/.p1 GENE.gb/GEZN01006551.1/~~gb/GEZN01006551.1/.p1  ORF type:complete len:402 (-),score=58.68 gb/GEZN01006551.1/:339-1544(-)